MNLHGRLLSQGLSGDDVRLLQYELQLLGYTTLAEELDQGIMGTFSLEAIRAFQEVHACRESLV